MTSSTMTLRLMRDRVAALAAGPRLHHALIYIPDPDEDAPAVRDIVENDRRIGPLPIGPAGAVAVEPFYTSSRVDLLPTGVNESGFATFKPLKPLTIEAVWSDAGDDDRIRYAVRDWRETVREIWGMLTAADWEPLRVESGPSLGLGQSDAHDWGRLLHHAAWSRRVPGLRARIRRYNMLPNQCPLFAELEGSPGDSFDLDPRGPMPHEWFAPSEAYASILILDAVGASLALIDYMIAPVGDEENEYRPASFFGKSMGSRLRKAAAPDRKSKRVRSKTVDGEIMYNLIDARRWWPRDIPDEK